MSTNPATFSADITTTTTSSSILRSDKNIGRMATWGALEAVDLNKHEPGFCCPNCDSPFESVDLEQLKAMLDPLELRNFEASPLNESLWLESCVCWKCHVGTDYFSFLKSLETSIPPSSSRSFLHVPTKKVRFAFKSRTEETHRYNSYKKEDLQRRWGNILNRVDWKRAGEIAIETEKKTEEVRTHFAMLEKQLQSMLINRPIVQ